MPVLAAAATAVFSAVTTVATAVGGAVLGSMGLSGIAGMGIASFTGSLTIGTAVGFAAIGSTALNMINMSRKLKAGAGSPSPLAFKADPNAYLHYVAGGPVAVGGHQVFAQTAGKKNAYLTYTTVLSAGGPVQSVQPFTANDNVVNFGGSQGAAALGLFDRRMWQKFSLGAVTGAVALTMANVTGKDAPGTDGGHPYEWTSAHTLPSLAHTLWTLKSDPDRFPQLPKPLWQVIGGPVYDPRKDSTFPGGDGPQRPHDRATWSTVGNTNPYLQALTFIIGHTFNGFRLGGVGAPLGGIDVPAFVYGANVADANGWKIAWTWNTGMRKWDVLATMLQAGGGQPLVRASKISCLVEAPRVSIGTITDADIKGPFSITGTSDQRERKNTIIPRCKSAAHKFTVQPFGPVTAQVYLDEDLGVERPVELEYEAIADNGDGGRQVRQIAAYDLANMREGLTGALPLPMKFMKYRAGDCLTVDAPSTLLNGQKIVITKREVDPKGRRVTLTFRSETDGKHDYALGRTASPPPSPVMTGVDPSIIQPPTPAAWVAEPGSGGDTGSAPVIVVRPSDPDPDNGGAYGDDAAAQAILLRWRAVDALGDPLGTGEWASGEYPAKSNRIELSGLQPRTRYAVEIAYRVRGVAGEWAFLGYHTTGDIVANDSLLVGGEPVSEIIDRLLSAEAIAGAASAAVQALQDQFDEVGDLAQAVADAAQAAADAADAAAAAVIAQGEAQQAAADALDEAQAAALAASQADGSATQAAASAVTATSAADDAQAAATAASSSASSAAASETAAGQSASAATTAKNQAETARGQAQTFASNASDSATTANAAASTATTQAGLATTARNQADGFATAAQTSRNQASSFADAAGVHAAAAEQSALTASTASDDAQDAATAASTSASNAAASETAAGTSASAATTAKNQAETARGQAQTSASNAATSASTASGAATTATTQANLATTARNEASGFATAASGAASTATSKANDAEASANAAAASQVAASVARDQAQAALAQQGRLNIVQKSRVQGAVVEFPDTASGWGYRIAGGITGSRFSYVGPLKQDTPYSISFKARLVSGTTTSLNVDLFPDTLPEKIHTITESTWTTFKWENVTSSHADMTGELVQLRFFRASLPAGHVFEVADIKLEEGATATAWTPNPKDIELAAQAAATSASSAAASQTAAGASATAAQGSATAAATQAGNAQTYANQASSSAGNAQAAAITAGTAASSAVGAVRDSGMVPPFTQDNLSRYWSLNFTGSPQSLPDLPAANIYDSIEGWSIRLQSSGEYARLKSYWTPVPGQVVRLTARAKRIGSTATSLQLIARGVDNAFASLGSNRTHTRALTTAGTVYTVSADFEMDEFIALGATGVMFRVSVSAASPDVYVSGVTIQDVTSETAAATSAATAVTQAANASASASAASISADLAASVAAPNANLIPNGGMEYGNVNGWLPDGGAYNFNGNVGGRNLRITTGTANKYVHSPSTEGVTSGAAPFSARIEYRVSSPPAGSFYQVCVVFYSDAAATVSVGQTPWETLNASLGTPLHVWKLENFTKPSGTVAMRILVAINTTATGGIVQLTRAKIEPGPKSTAYSAEATTAGLSSSLNVTAATTADLATRMATARFEVTAAAGGNLAQLKIRADSTSSLAQLVAGAISFSNTISGTVVKVMEIVSGSVYITGKLFMGAAGQIELDPSYPLILWKFGTARLAIGQLPNDSIFFWFGGGSTAVTSMRKNNAKVWFDTAGNSYWGGSIIAGTLSNSIRGSNTTVPASVTLGPFATNGGPITVAWSYDYNRMGQRWGNQTGGITGSTTATVRLYRKIGTAAETLVDTMTVTGSHTADYDGEPWPGQPAGTTGRTMFTEYMGGSRTYTDNAGGTQTRTYRIEVAARTTIGVPGQSSSADNTGQFYGITSSE